jgi:hypothetical protein
MQNRLLDKVGTYKWGFDKDGLMAEFKLLHRLSLERYSLQNKLILDAFHHEEVLAELISKEKDIETQKVKIDTFDFLPLDENPLVGLMMETDLSELVTMDINYLRKMLFFTIYNARVFDEYILMRAIPIDSEEYRITDGFGPQSSINFRRSSRSRTDDSDSDEQEEESNEEESI